MREKGDTDGVLRLKRRGVQLGHSPRVPGHVLGEWIACICSKQNLSGLCGKLDKEFGLEERRNGFGGNFA